MDNRKLGIYIGKDKISVVEAKANQIVRQVSIPLENLDSTYEGSLPADASGDIRLVANIKSTLRNNNIEAGEVVVGLSSKDLFIRGFQMPLLGRAEIDSGVRFEAKKYLPSKTEDLVFDYQRRFDKKLGKMDVLFVATTQSSFDRYLSLFKQLGFLISAIEPANLALIRTVFLNKQIEPKSSFAVVALEGADVEFSIVVDGFPCYSRDVKLSAALGDIAANEGNAEFVFLERLSSELRVSLDYFRRQFSGRSVDKIIFIAKNISGNLISDLSKNLGINVQLVDLSTNKELNVLADLDSLKGYSLAIRDSVKINLGVDLFKKKREQLEDSGEIPVKFTFSVELFKKPLIAGALVLGMLFLSLGWFPSAGKVAVVVKRSVKLKNESKNLVILGLSTLSLDVLRLRESQADSKLKAIEALFKNESYLTPSFSVLPRAVKWGMRIDEFSVSSKDSVRLLRIKGVACLNDAEQEKKIVEDFQVSLKNYPEIMQGLNDLELLSFERMADGDREVSSFEISGK